MEPSSSSLLPLSPRMMFDSGSSLPLPSPPPPPPPFDLIGNLMNFPHILEKIFSYLPPKDLRAIPCVCSDWYQSIYHITPLANRRRLRAIKHLKKVKHRVGTENWPIDYECAKFKRKLRSSRDRNVNIQQRSAQPAATAQSRRRRTLGAIQNVVTANHKLTKLNRNDQNHPEDDEERVTRKKSRWILAQEPFKKW